jgi:hypothetical protein
MNYEKMYQQLITARRNNGIPIGYTEVHHILPRSFGGSNEGENLVEFTAREHFVAHRLLAKIYPESGMVHAAFKMACVNLTMKRFRVTSRIYEQLRIAHAHRVSTDPVSKLKKSIAGKGKKQSADHIAARTASRLENGPWLSEETKIKIGDGNRGKIGPWAGKVIPKEMIEKRTKTRKDSGTYNWTEQQKIAQSVRQLGKPSKKPKLTVAEKQKLRVEKSKPVTCPHCGKVGAMMVMPRWHFDNCPKRLT